jgi:RimJ/RimL family protein N-acetyltransferase
MLKVDKVVLREKRLEDANNDYKWKTDGEITRLDATSPLNVIFSVYLSNYAEELCCPSLMRRRFAIETKEGEHIGNCMYYNIDGSKKEAELGIIIGDRHYWDRGYGPSAAAILLNRIFQEPNLEKVYLHTLEWNIRAQRCFEKCGFTIRGRTIRNGHRFLIMELSKKEYEEES